MQASKPDSRIFASYPMPAKIDLLNERPRRESLVERQLEDNIGQISPGVPRITVNEQVTTTTASNTNNYLNSALGQQQRQQQQQPQTASWKELSTSGADNFQESTSESRSPTGRREVRETRIVINRHSSPLSSSPIGTNQQYGEQVFTNTTDIMRQQQLQQQQQQQRQVDYRVDQAPQNDANHSGHSGQSTTITTTTTTSSNNKAILANELANKEAELMREIETLNQRPYSASPAPNKLDWSNEQSRLMPQQQLQYNTSPRPHSSASSTGADLLEKEAKLLREIEEIESKPYNPQTMVVEREKWYEYPKNHPGERHLTDSKRRVRDFCTMPTGLCQDRYIHEENLPLKNQPSPTPGSMHTTIIRSPKREIDNKSPLPFAFDNFTTKGVRGNIASVGAVEPDRPRAPIFPIVKRTPSPAFAQY